MESEHLKYRTYTRNVRAFLAFSGLWPETSPVLRRVLASLALFSNSVVALTVLNFCVHHASDIMILTRGMGMVISMTTSCLKVIMFLLHQKDISFLNQQFSKRYVEDLSKPDNRSHLLIRIAPFSTVLYILISTGCLTIIMYGLIPILAWRRHGKFPRMYPSIYPFAYEPGGLVHWIIYGLELVSGMFLCSVTTGVDCSFGMYSLQICGQLRLLAKMFEELRLDRDYKRNARQCMERHQLIISAKNRLESTFGLLSIWIAVSAGTVLCALIFQFTEAVKARATGLHMGVMTMYIVLKFLQVFTYAWYGDIIADESDLCLHSVYNSYWTDVFDSNFRKDVLFVLRQRPLTMKAKGCMYIQLDMFSKIVNTTVSYFFLLQTLNDKS